MQVKAPVLVEYVREYNATDQAAFVCIVTIFNAVVRRFVISEEDFTERRPPFEAESLRKYLNQQLTNYCEALHASESSPL